MLYTIENEYLKVTLDTFGAEMKSLIRKQDGAELLWNGDPGYWKRSAPVLFPFVGSLKNKEYHYKGQTYPMGQHGFARDMEFAICGGDCSRWISFELVATPETKKVYPFSFRLIISYHLQGTALKCTWKVINTDPKERMYYSIGAHPAFMCPVGDHGKQTDYRLVFSTESGELIYSKLSENGLIESEGHKLSLVDHELIITEHLFDEDALVVEGNQAERVGLVNPEGRIYLLVHFDAPLFGLWSPAGKGAPFICIEPWYGRCDKESFGGELQDRDYEYQLMSGEEKEYNYCIEVPWM